jgi:hypothetical protein
MTQRGDDVFEDAFRNAEIVKKGLTSSADRMTNQVRRMKSFSVSCNRRNRADE